MEVFSILNITYKIGETEDNLNKFLFWLHFLIFFEIVVSSLTLPTKNISSIVELNLLPSGKRRYQIICKFPTFIWFFPMCEDFHH